MDAVLNKAGDGSGGLQLDSVCEGDVGVLGGCTQAPPPSQGRAPAREPSPAPPNAVQEGSEPSGGGDDGVMLSGGGDDAVVLLSGGDDGKVMLSGKGNDSGVMLSGGGDDGSKGGQPVAAAESGAQSDGVRMTLPEVTSPGQCTFPGGGVRSTGDRVVAQPGALDTSNQAHTPHPTVLA